jgi:hypothetical protein
MINYFNENCSGKQSESAYRAAQKLNKNQNQNQNQKTHIKTEESSITENNKKLSKYSLSIISSPKSAKIKILNIKPKYYSGMKLKEGKYHIEISLAGYETLTQWVNLTKNESISFSLKKKNSINKENIDTNLQPQKIIKTTDSLSKSNLSSQERKMIENACNAEKILHGAAAYNNCIQNKKRELSGIQPPKFDDISTDERRMIENACSAEKILRGPAAYYNCMQGKKRELSGIQAPKFDGISTNERRMIENACSAEKILRGPAAYYNCMQGKKRELLR